ncbi:MAG: hypothetical protein VYE73_05855 [Acidobacteriota bacterium]|nr:hypothetical protein [Acidobacteriota bacterium]
MRIRTQCTECGLPFPAVLDPASVKLQVIACPNCDMSRPVTTAGWKDKTVEACPLCGCKHLYRQRDFNRAWGCGLVAIGAVFVPWTYGLSLVALSLVDFLLYRRIGNSVVCYKCDTVYRDATPLKRQSDFDLLKHDVLKYGKTWDDTRTPESPDGTGVHP